MRTVNFLVLSPALEALPFCTGQVVREGYEMQNNKPHLKITALDRKGKVLLLGSPRTPAYQPLIDSRGEKINGLSAVVLCNVPLYLRGNHLTNYAAAAIRIIAARRPCFLPKRSGSLGRDGWKRANSPKVRARFVDASVAVSLPPRGHREAYPNSAHVIVRRQLDTWLRISTRSTSA